MKRKTVEVPPEWEPEQSPDAPVFVLGGRERDERDTSKPIAYDEQGRPLYAPRGVLWRAEE